MAVERAKQLVINSCDPVTGALCRIIAYGTRDVVARKCLYEHMLLPLLGLDNLRLIPPFIPAPPPSDAGRKRALDGVP